MDFNLAQEGQKQSLIETNFRGDLEGLRKGTLDRCKHLFSSRVPGKFQQIFVCKLKNFVW